MGSGLALAGAPGVARADGRPYEGLTIAEFEQIMDPEHYAALPDSVKEELSAHYMYESVSGLTRADVGSSVRFTDVSVGYGQVAFTFKYTTTVSCSSLFTRVTLMNSSQSFQAEFNGSGAALTGSRTFYSVPSGTYSLVATAYAPSTPNGYTSSPVQAIRSVTV
jgi:hypothetical protein